MFLAAALALAAFAAGCRSTEGHDRAAETADRVVAVGDFAGQTQLRLDKTLDALEQIVATASQDPMPAFQAFADEFEEFQDEFADLRREREGFESTAKSWLAAFERQNSEIQDADLRQSGAARLVELRADVAGISRQIDALIAETQALDVRLKDLRTYLGNDLSAKGIELVAQRIGVTARDGRQVAASLGQLFQSAESLTIKMRAARRSAPAS